MPRVAAQKKPRTPAQLAADAAGAERLANARKRVAPVVVRKEVDARRFDIPQEPPRKFRDKKGKQELEPRQIVIPETPLDPEKMANLAFMEEMVTVHIHTTTNPQDEQVFELFNNGRREVFKRNETKTVKRYFVDGLARAKPTSYTQLSTRNAQGERVESQRGATGLKYPFSVIEDKNPMGAAWLRWAMAQGI